MTGVVASCHLTHEGILAGTSSFNNEKFLQHRISIDPFAQEIVRETAVIFQSFGLPASGVRGTYSSGGFAFVTRGQGKRATMSFKGGYAVPKKKASTDSDDDLFDIDAVPLRPAFDNNNATRTVLEYDDIGGWFPSRFATYLLMIAIQSPSTMGGSKQVTLSGSPLRISMRCRLGGHI
ncbi:hypothetical protein DXG01_012410 [Tephrocybe rancida]|nr:hypothetical protein DXG01_012410 [Tephrocybe rancida]